MNRDHLEKLNTNPAWATAYEAALAKAEAIHGAGHADALSYATTAADLAVAEADEIQAEAQRAIDHANFERAHGSAQVAPPAPAADAGSTTRASWSRAIEAANKQAGVRKDAVSVPDTAAAGVVEAAPASAGGGWSKAISEANARMGSAAVTSTPGGPL